MSLTPNAWDNRSGADDGQLYVNCPAADAEVTICQLEACMDDSDAWVKANPEPTDGASGWTLGRQQHKTFTLVDIELMSATL